MAHRLTVAPPLGSLSEESETVGEVLVEMPQTTAYAMLLARLGRHAGHSYRVCLWQGLMTGNEWERGCQFKVAKDFAEKSAQLYAASRELLGIIPDQSPLIQ